MDHLLYVSSSGASRVLQAQQVHSNNLSNADTAGFRADMERAQSVAINGAGFAGRAQVQTNSASTNFDTGALVKTGRALDVAINGEGFFSVQTLQGEEAYTRAGNINVDSDGLLTVNGFSLLGQDGPIILPHYQAVDISEKGLISIVPPGGGAEVEVAQLKLVKPELNQLQKQSDGLFHPLNQQALANNDNVQLVAEHIEGSNVSAINELVSVMSLSRSFEMQVRMMKTAETIAQAGNRLISNR